MARTRVRVTGLEGLGARIDQAVGAHIKAGAKAIQRELIDTTPIDTGRARSNWFATRSPIPGNMVPSIAPGRFGSTAGSVRSSTIARNDSIINAIPDRQPVYILNYSTYIGLLDQGWSKQASPGFISRAADAGLAKINAYLKKVKI